MEAVDILVRRDRLQHPPGMDRFGQRQLHEDAMDRGIGVELRRPARAVPPRWSFQADQIAGSESRIAWPPCPWRRHRPGSPGRRPTSTTARPGGRRAQANAEPRRRRARGCLARRLCRRGRKGRRASRTFAGMVMGGSRPERYGTEVASLEPATSAAALYRPVSSEFTPQAPLEPLRRVGMSRERAIVSILLQSLFHRLGRFGGGILGAIVVDLLVHRRGGWRPWPFQLSSRRRSGRWPSEVGARHVRLRLGRA